MLYRTTPTDYPSTTRGTSVGHPIAVNIDICGYFRFLSINLSELYGYSMPLTTFLVKKEFLLHRPVSIFQPTVNSRASDNHSKQCQNRISQLEKCAVMKCLCIYQCLWRALGGAGGTFFVLYESLTFKGPEALQAVAVNRIGVNKIAPNFNTQFAMCIYKSFGYLKGSLRDVYVSHSVLKG